MVGKQRFAFRSPNKSWLSWVGLAVAVGITYFMAARFGLAFRAKPGGVAVFWPAAGIAIGALIALGPDARLPVAAAVAVATITSKLLITGNFLLGITFGAVCAGQTLLTAWLIERWFGRAFKLEDAPQVVGFLVASAVGAALAAVGAAVAVSLVHSAASPLDVWRLWFASCLLGTVTVAPLLIGLGEAVREPPPRRELIEGGVGVATLAALSVFVISLPQGPWATALPVALVFPVLLWVTVRCRPVFAAGATFVVALAVIWSATFDMGHFGDPSIPVADRILAAQTLVLAGALLALLLAALFAERRQNESTLKMSNERLKVDISERKKAELALAERNIQLALAGKAALVGSYAYDTDTEIMQISEGYAAIHGFSEGTAEIGRSECLAGVHAEDIGRVNQFRSEAFREHRLEYNVEYRIIRAGEVRWVETRCFISYNGEGQPQRVVGVSIDITERKRVEEQQRTLLAELDHRVKNALATVSAVVSHTRQGSRSVTDFAAALHGRIRSMATSHELLSSRRWHGVSLAELVRRELAPYATRNNTEINGPGVSLKPEAGQALGMVLHELATNAAKYGALSTRYGRVSIRWDRHLNGHSRPNLVFEWQEIGGPPVVALGKSSYGTSTIRDLIPYEFGGTVDLVLALEGVRCRLELPADWLASDRQPLSPPDMHLGEPEKPEFETGHRPEQNDR